MSAFWTQQRVVITGGSGFLGKHVVAALKARGCTDYTVPRSAQFNLTRPDDIKRLLDRTNPTLILHLAAVCGGIGANRAHPGRFFYENAIMGIQLLEAARVTRVPKVVTVGTICAYPKFAPVPFKEDAIWDGYPEETNAPYGLAKKMLLVQSQAYRQEYGSNFIYILPVNLYGPEDNFDLETSHVIPALIRKMETARIEDHPSVTLWGTGSASREFLYAEDCAEGLLRAAEHFNGPEPVNLGAGFEITIRELAELVKTLTGFEGRIEWDASKPDGQPRRMLDTSRAEQAFGFRAQTSLEEGLRKTIDWFRTHAAAVTA